ncbi:serine/threonine kinase [Acanthamoeba castellanii str. Neff]|uniref:non-specific serine/threonine protein kinase n=1 Tax=Acanthamoeba castellanii (strain ATCC 30010 / Neff) TaxID=1257118 RepID=L8GKP9_ACACF|nr:serine/threonine kinase [Acanthamoeba castellanii str. Neff]ELR13625.1 serine/threonine kinase [Acanthamoeba castellanii str. Neff]
METARGKMSVSGPIRSMHRIHVDAELVWSPFGSGADEQVAGGRDMFALDDEPIGQGAFGKVFRATHRSGFQLAIKEIDLSILDRMSLAGGVSYYGSLWAEKNRLWILMEYCQAGSVRDLMETINLPSMKEKQIAFVMHTTLQGLAYLHQQAPPITHFDVKANNVLITSEGTAKLADFGLARKIDDANGKRPVAGTRYWMAPELFERGQPKAGPPADIWSLGITGIELAHGQPPYFDEGPMEAMRAITQRPPPRLSDFGHEGKKRKKWSHDFEDFAGRKTVLHKSLTKRNKVIKQRKKEAAKSDSEQKAKPRKVTKLLHTKKRSKGEEEKQENRDEEAKTDESGSGEETEDTDTEHGDHEPNGGDAAPPRHRAAPSLSSQGSSFLDNAKVPLLGGDSSAGALARHRPPSSAKHCCCILS